MTRSPFRFPTLPLTSLALSAALAACASPSEVSEDEAFRRGIPRKETVEMQVPAAAGQALVTERRAQAAATAGSPAEFYLLTRGVSRVVNGGGALVLGLVKEVVSHPPTTVTPDTATWGPWTEALSPTTWKVTVLRVADGKYQYRFEGKPKQAADTAFVTVLTGTHAPSVDASGDPMEGFGSGSFTLDFDAARTLPEPGDDVGKAHYVYARPRPGATTSVEAKFVDVKDDERPGVRVNVDYRYSSTGGQGGAMEFSHTAPASVGMKGARFVVKSRWKETGAGRSDVKARGGELPPGAQVTASECWDTAFASRYLRASWALAAPGGVLYGSEATDCAFAAAEYSNL